MIAHVSVVSQTMQTKLKLCYTRLGMCTWEILGI